MNVQILTPTGKTYSGEVMGIQLPGITGSFEVLKNHAPLVSALKAGKLKILVDKTRNEFYQIEEGFVEVLNNQVTVMVEGAKAVE
ncbi:MAG: ATP synthase F1 subunit epsilon [Bacteroidetes bacterium]|nr:ATP synthase F1 subunit epsilon [Bacteroidota bacterium]